jgi:hypothetical protein
MIYDVKNFDQTLTDFVKTRKKYLSLLNRELTPEVLEKMDIMKAKLANLNRRIKALRTIYDNPDKLHAQFTGCALVTFKTQEMKKKVLKESTKSGFFTVLENLDDNDNDNTTPKERKIAKFVIKKAPEPSDMIWSNHVREFDGKTWFYMSLVAIVLVNFVFFYIFKYIKKLQNNYLKNNDEINMFVYCKS